MTSLWGVFLAPGHFLLADNDLPDENEHTDHHDNDAANNELDEHSVPDEVKLRERGGVEKK